MNNIYTKYKINFFKINFKINNKIQLNFINF